MRKYVGTYGKWWELWSENQWPYWKIPDGDQWLPITGASHEAMKILCWRILANRAMNLRYSEDRNVKKVTVISWYFLAFLLPQKSPIFPSKNTGKGAWMCIPGIGWYHIEITQLCMTYPLQLSSGKRGNLSRKTGHFPRRHVTRRIQRLHGLYLDWFAGTSEGTNYTQPSKSI